MLLCSVGFLSKSFLSVSEKHAKRIVSSTEKLGILGRRQSFSSRALEISQTYFNYSPDEWNQGPLAHRSTYTEFTTVDSKLAPSCVPGTYLFSVASSLRRLYTVDLMSGTFPHYRHNILSLQQEIHPADSPKAFFLLVIPAADRAVPSHALLCLCMCMLIWTTMEF